MENRKIVSRTLSSQVAEALESAIIKGEWKIGQKIPSESELLRWYGVSRNTLREAVHYLSMTGVLDVRPGDGTYVCNRTVFDAAMHTRIAKEEAATIMETRLLIEPAIAGLAAKRRTDEEAKMLQAMDAEVARCHQEHDQTYLQKDMEFHRYLVRLCHNSLITDLYSGVLQRYPELIPKSFPDYEYEKSEYICASHEKLCEAILKQNDADAKSCMEATLEQIITAMKNAGLM